jgi:hypothetical protein
MHSTDISLCRIINGSVDEGNQHYIYSEQTKRFLLYLLIREEVLYHIKS